MAGESEKITAGSGNESVDNKQVIESPEDFKITTKEALEVKNELEKIPGVVRDANDQVGKLQQISELLGRKTRAVVFAFSMLMASQAKEAMADESKSVAKIEMQELNLDKLKERLTVSDSLRSLAEYEDPVASYVFACDRAIFMAEHMKDMLTSEKEIFLQNANKLPSVKEVENVNNAEGRMYFLGEYQKQIGAVNSVGGEIQIRIEQGYTITDVAQNGE